MNLAPSSTWTLVKRELLTSLRSWKSLILMLLLLAVLYYIAFSALDRMSQNVMYAATTMQNIFNVQVGLMLFTAMVMVPAMAAASLGRERAEGSYELLLTTLIPPSRIAFGKIVAVLVVFLLIGIALLPFTGLVYFFAGVDVYRFFEALAIILPVALAGASVGLWASSLIAHPGRAIYLTFFLMVLVNVILPGVVSWYARSANGLILMSPFGLIGGRYTIGSPWAAFGTFALYQGSVAVLAFLGTLYRLSRFRGLTPAREFVQAVLPRRKSRRFVPIPDKANPIGAREKMGSGLARGMTRYFAIAIVFFSYAFGISYFGNIVQFEGVIGASVYLERMLLLILVPPVVAVAWVRDTEESTWDMLRLSLLSPKDVLAGKIRGVVHALWPLFAPIYAINCLMIFGMALSRGEFTEEYWLWAFPAEALLFPIHALMVITASLMGATFTRTVTTAVGAAYGSVACSLFAFLFISASVAMGGGSNIVGFVFFHLFACGFALFIALAITIARIDHLLQSFPTPVTARPEGGGTTPPPLPHEK